jgi:hypothetical protein
MWMFGGSSVSRSGVPDGVQYSTSPAADITGSPANDSDDAVAGSAKGSRMQPSIHIEVNWQLLWFITAELVKCVALFLSLWPDWFWGQFTALSSRLPCQGWNDWSWSPLISQRLGFVELCVQVQGQPYSLFLINSKNLRFVFLHVKFGLLPSPLSSSQRMG